jgi:hypothetical protein
MKQKHHRLWPLFFLPLVGLLAGLFVAFAQHRLPFDLDRRYDPAYSAAIGLFAGSLAIVAMAFLVLIYRLSQRRFTIASVLITIALIALLLAWARPILFMVWTLMRP